MRMLKVHQAMFDRIYRFLFVFFPALRIVFLPPLYLPTFSVLCTALPTLPSF